MVYGKQVYGLAAAALCASLEEFQSSAIGLQPPSIPPSPALMALSHPDRLSHPLVKQKSRGEGSWHWKELVLGEGLAWFLVDT